MLSATLMTLARDRGRSALAAGILHGTTDALAVTTLVIVEAPDFPWMPGVSDIVAYATAALLIARFRPDRPDRTAIRTAGAA